jgi:hypothetical protein
VKLGAAAAYQRVCDYLKREDLQLLYALAAGIKDLGVVELSVDEIQKLHAEWEQLRDQ